MNSLELLLPGLFAILIIVLVSTSFTFLWRTCIYARGGIFRFVGRALDNWVERGTRFCATPWDKVLRFIAYPLGRCIFCSGFHFTYEIFFLMNWAFGLGLGVEWLIVALPINHMFVTIYDRYWCTNNTSLEKDDWDSLKEEMNAVGTYFQYKQREIDEVCDVDDMFSDKELKELDESISQSHE